MINLSLASSTWGSEEIETCERVLKSGSFTMGQEVKNFEEKFARYIGTSYALMFNSGSSANLALIFALKYMKHTPLIEGDEFIVPAVSWSTTYYPVSQAGFKLNFVDIDLNSLNISMESISQALSPATRGIFAVNLLGNPSQLIELENFAMQNGLLLIEDNCESLGANLQGRNTGSFGIAGTHSFFFSHHICTMEGGMVTTNSKELAETLQSIRAHGWLRGLPKENSVHPLSEDPWEDLFKFVLPGFNLRPLELSGAVGQEQLLKFPNYLQTRRENAEHFKDLFKDSEHFITQVENGNSSWFGFSLVLKKHLRGRRKNFIDELRAVGVETRPIVAGNFVRNPVMKYLNHTDLGLFENADYIHENGFFVGNHHFDVKNELSQVFTALTLLAEEIN